MLTVREEIFYGFHDFEPTEQNEKLYQFRRNRCIEEHKRSKSTDPDFEQVLFWHNESQERKLQAEYKLYASKNLSRSKAQSASSGPVPSTSSGSVAPTSSSSEMQDRSICPPKVVPFKNPGRSIIRYIGYKKFEFSQSMNDVFDSLSGLEIPQVYALYKKFVFLRKPNEEGEEICRIITSFTTHGRKKSVSLIDQKNVSDVNPAFFQTLSFASVTEISYRLPLYRGYNLCFPMTFNTENIAQILFLGSDFITCNVSPRSDPDVKVIVNFTLGQHQINTTSCETVLWASAGFTRSPDKFDLFKWDHNDRYFSEDMSQFTVIRGNIVSETIGLLTECMKNGVKDQHLKAILCWDEADAFESLLLMGCGAPHKYAKLVGDHIDLISMIRFVNMRNIVADIVEQSMMDKRLRSMMSKSYTKKNFRNELLLEDAIILSRPFVSDSEYKKIVKKIENQGEKVPLKRLISLHWLVDKLRSEGLMRSFFLSFR